MFGLPETMALEIVKTSDKPVKLDRLKLREPINDSQKKLKPPMRTLDVVGDRDE